MAKHNIKVCMGSSCFARGNLDNLNFLENYIQENNLDAQIELVGGLCTEDCGCGPNIYINDKKYTEVNIEKLEEILSSLVCKK
ncbi:MAG: (2Fe-2S) ferredoxin domain-containing protein [Cyanobacteria bacterium SIG26]|nr:(2Fe-2S) ferredoxin domain-containing protein [Cyanobacteria bacterium SIG26]